MNRKLIKQEAKQKYKNNKWKIWVPLLLIALVTTLFKRGVSLAGINLYDINRMVTTSGYIITLISSLISSVLSLAYIKYMLEFVRTGNFITIKEALDFLKDKWTATLIGTILITIITSIGYILLIIPGIILTMGFTMFYFLLADNKTNDAVEGLKMSWEMMKGYKWDYFVFCLSFIGWILLSILTLGILMIWTIPYMQTAYTLYYEKLKETKEIN